MGTTTKKGGNVKTITFAIPCYNSAEYMDKCIESCVACGDDVEVLIINDGSTKDNTSEKAHEWERRYPGIVRAIDKENGGHGSGVNRGIQESNGLYYKVVDSDDWLDVDAMKKIMSYLRRQMELRYPTDMVIANYVYEKVYEGTRTVRNYKNVFPIEREFSWSETGRWRPDQVLLMHSVIYRTQLLKDIKLQLPEHCFYVDNIFVYVPLEHVKTMYYFDLDMYRYFIGREGQSVNQEIMLSRIDQQLHITRVMIDAVDLSKIKNERLLSYLERYLGMMMAICSVFLRMRKTPEDEAKRHEIWNYLYARNEKLGKRLRHQPINVTVNMESAPGRDLGLRVYGMARGIFKFN